MPNILVVDDKSDNVYYLTALLSACGHTVATARNGRDALEYARRMPPDLVIADLLMPVMDGYTLLRNWKADPILREIGFIVYTATYIAPADQKLALELGADAFVVKPMEPEAMINLINKILDLTDKNVPQPVQAPAIDSLLLNEYNAALVRKLEDKTIALEAANRSLRLEIEERTRLSIMRDAVLDSLPAMIAVLDMKGDVVVVNETWVTFGLRNGASVLHSTIGTNYFKICEKAKLDGIPGMSEVSAGIRDVLDGKLRSFITEYPCQTPQGLLWFRLVVSPMNEPQINGVVVTHINVTDVKTAEERNRKTSERLALALDAAAIGIWEWSPGEPLIWDDRMYDLYGLPRGTDVDLVRWSSFVHPDDAETAQQTVDLIAAAGGHRERQYRMTTASGAKRKILETGRSIVRDDGAGLRYVGTNVDITERHALEEQLRQSQRLEAVGRMTGGVAHDFNNLLTVIMGNGEILEQALEDTPRLRSLAAMIVDAADRGATLSNQLLSFSRRQILAPRTVSIKALLLRLLPLLKQAVGGKVEVQIVGAADLWTALIDPPELENAIVNLCVNARDAMPGGGTVTITTQNVVLDGSDDLPETEVAMGDYVLIRLSDTGTGMDDDTRLRAFDPFFTTKDVGKGSGLGLSMVYGFVRQSRGMVRILSEPGRGTTVELYLRRSEGVEAPPVAQTEQGQVANGRETILVVEDDAVLRKQVSAQLATLGYQVLVAQDGFEALQVLQSNPDCDLLFTDMLMPRGMSGQQLANAALRLRPKLAVLFTSGFTEDEMSDADGPTEDHAVLRKPYRHQKLAEMVRGALDANETPR